MRLRSFGLACGVILSAFLAGCGGGGGGNNNPGSPSITTSGTLPAGVVNSAYGPLTFAATGGTPPYSWSTTTSSLPAGLSLSSAGVLSGTPTAAGKSSFTVTVTDSKSMTGTLAATLTVNAGLSITTNSLPAGAVGDAYSVTLAATGGVSPYSWSLASGSNPLPAGLSLSTAGVISGTPTAASTGSVTIQVSDSETTAQKTTANLVLTINPALAITTTSLPNGTQGTAYSQQLAATGGIPPYTWSVSPSALLPGGLNVSTSGVVSGTPAGASNTSPGFIVTDSASGTATANIALLVNPVAAGPLTGSYVFMFAGTPPAGGANQASIALDGTFTVSNGAVQAGEFDENNNNGTPMLQQPISGGTFTNYTDGLGQLVLNVPGGSITFSLAIPATGSDIRMIEYTDTTGAGTRGSGLLKAAAATPAQVAGLSGEYGFLISGAGTNGGQEALVASVGLSGTGTITGGAADSNQEGTHIQFAPPSGTYEVDAQGRGLLHLSLEVPTFPAATFNYSFYQVSPGEWLMMSIDPATANAPVVIGSVYKQTGAPFGATPLPAGNYVLGTEGLATGPVPDVIAGIGVSNGSGSLTITYDEFNGTLATDQNLALTYAVDATTPATGHIGTTDSSGAGPVIYLIDGVRAFYLGRGTSATSGMLDTQVGSGFTNASFSGNYLGGSVPLVAPPVLNEAGLVQADGSGNFIMTTNRSDPSGLTLYQYLTGTYSVDPTGRVVVTTPDGLTRIFYIVSSANVVYLTNDSGGYLGNFEQ